MDSHGNARRNDTLKYAAESREQSLPKQSLRVAPPLLPIPNRSVFSFQIVLPLVQRTEQGFANSKRNFLPNPRSFASLFNSKPARQLHRIAFLSRSLTSSYFILQAYLFDLPF